MNRLAMAITFLAVGFGLIISLNGCGGSNTETVTAASVSELPSGKTLEIDLAKKDYLGRRTVYKFDDPGTDFSRVTIRTPAGLKTFGDLLKQANTGPGKLVLGTPKICAIICQLREAERHISTAASFASAMAPPTVWT